MSYCSNKTKYSTLGGTTKAHDRRLNSVAVEGGGDHFSSRFKGRLEVGVHSVAIKRYLILVTCRNGESNHILFP